ncbi:MAG: hypothetical protein AB7O21_02605 [Gammaproteobacteria bacterium]
MSMLLRILGLCVLAGVFLVASFAGNLLHSILASVPHGTRWLWTVLVAFAALGLVLTVQRRRRARRPRSPDRA